MSRMPPDRAPPYDEKQAFARFDLPDGRHIFIRREGVLLVYDVESLSRPSVTDGKWGITDDPRICHVVTASNVMPVPYTAEQAMEILFP